MKFVHIFLILVLAICFRLFLIHIAPQPFVWDQIEYELYAQRMLSHPGLLAAFGNRPYPYPMLLACMYYFFGTGNHTAVYVLQAVLDSLTGLFVYLLIRFGLGMKKTAWVGFLLYSINPFTSVYAGLVLSEVMATFCLTATFVCGLLFVKFQRLRYAVLFGIFAGLTGEVRGALLPWVILLPLIALVSFRSLRRSWLVVGVVAGILVTFVYPLVTNWRDYHEFTVSTVDNIFAMEFYNGATIDQLPANASGFPQTYWNMMAEYYTEAHPWRTPADRHAIANKYIGLALAAISSRPADWLVNRLYKMWYVWQKQQLFVLVDPWATGDGQVVAMVNELLLAAAIVGIASAGIVSKKKIPGFIMHASFATIIYATLMFSMTQGEQRLTVPFYPILIILACVGTASLGSVLRKRP